MMEEISVVTAYDSHVFSKLYDEDFLASLVAISKPRYVVGVYIMKYDLLQFIFNVYNVKKVFFLYVFQLSLF